MLVSYAGFANGPDKEFTYTRITPAATTNSMGEVLADLVPSPATAGNYLQPIVLDFPSTTDVAFPGAQLLAPSRDGIRQVGSDLARGFTIPGDRDSGGCLEVRAYGKNLDGSYASVGVLIPVRVEYVEGYTPDVQQESAGTHTRLKLTPATRASGRALWQPGSKIVVDVQAVLPTKVISYE